MMIGNSDQDLLDEQAAEIERLLATLKGIAEYCSGDGHPLGAIERLAAVRNTAERAIKTTERIPLSFPTLTVGMVTAMLAAVRVTIERQKARHP